MVWLAELEVMQKLSNCQTYVTLNITEIPMFPEKSCIIEDVELGLICSSENNMCDVWSAGTVFCENSCNFNDATHDDSGKG